MNERESYFRSRRAPERLDDRQDDDADEQQRGNLVEHAIPALRARIAVRGELLDEREARAVIRDHEEYQHELHVQPAHE